MNNKDVRKRKTKFYCKQAAKRSHKFVLEPGLRGFLCTCNNREKECVREAYNLLNEYGDKMFGEEGKVEKSVQDASDGDNSEEDIELALNKEVNSMQAKGKEGFPVRRFQLSDSGVRNCLFIRTEVEDPVKLVHSILKDIKATQKQKTRFLLRMLPVEVTCKANLDDIKKSVEALLDKYFSSEGKTFSVLFRTRNNSYLSRDDVIPEIAQMVKSKNELNKADLNQPQLAIVVEIVRKVCCIAVIPDYFELRKYNLMELSHIEQNSNVKKDEDVPDGQGDRKRNDEGESVVSSEIDQKIEGDAEIHTEPEHNGKTEGNTEAGVESEHQKTETHVEAEGEKTEGHVEAEGNAEPHVE